MLTRTGQQRFCVLSSDCGRIQPVLVQHLQIHLKCEWTFSLSTQDCACIWIDESMPRGTTKHANVTGPLGLSRRFFKWSDGKPRRQTFPRDVQPLFQRKKTGVCASLIIDQNNLFYDGGFWHNCNGARLVLRPRCVHRQVSCTPDPARMSTDRPAAESILSRPLIGSPIHVRGLCTCGKSF